VSGNINISAAISSIAEFPELAKSTLITQDTNDAGVYAVRLYVRGKPWVVTVDDYVATFFDNKNNATTPIFSSIGSNNQFWAIILEKAFAKIKGTYASTNTANFLEVISTFAGCPVFQYNIADFSTDAEVLSLIKGADDANYIIGASTSG